MTWIAPDVERAEPPYVADERIRFDAWLDYHRATPLRKCAGLTGQQLATRPLASSALSLLGFLRHMAANERIWFRIRFAGADVEDLYPSAEHPEGGEFALADPAGAEGDLATYADEVAQAQLAVRGRSLGETSRPRAPAPPVVITRAAAVVAEDQMIEVTGTSSSSSCHRRVVFTDSYPVTSAGRVCRIELPVLATGLLADVDPSDIVKR